MVWFSLIVEQDAGFSRADLVRALSDSEIGAPDSHGKFLKNTEVLTHLITGF